MGFTCDFTSLIPCIPDWLLLIFVGLVFILVYRVLDEQTRASVNKFLRNYGFWIVLGIIWIYWRMRTGTIYESPEKWPATLNRADFFIGLAALLYWGVKSWLFEFRYYTNHFICDNIQGSCHRWHRIANVGGTGNSYIVLLLGGSGISDEKFCIPWPWIHKIVIVPESSVQFIGNQIVSFTQAEKVNILDLDEEIYNFIQADTFTRWAKDEIYFGLWNIEAKMQNPELTQIQQNIEKKNATINKYKEMLNGNLSTFKQFVSDTMGITKKLKGDDWRRNPNNNQGQGEGA